MTPIPELENLCEKIILLESRGKRSIAYSGSMPVDPEKMKYYFDHTVGDFQEVPYRNVKTIVSLGFPDRVNVAGQTWKKIHESFPKVREYEVDDAGIGSWVSTDRLDKSKGPHSVYYTDGVRLLRIADHWGQEMSTVSTKSDGYENWVNNVGGSEWTRIPLGFTKYKDIPASMKRHDGRFFMDDDYSERERPYDNGKRAYTGGVIAFNDLEFLNYDDRDYTTPESIDVKEAVKAIRDKFGASDK